MPNTKQPHIAIVDDDKSIGRAIKRLIHSLGMSAEAYGSSTQFVDLIEAQPSFHPDCVILDVQMPGMSGIEVLAHLRRVRDTIPVVLMTAHEGEAVRQQAFSGGAIAFLRKPFEDALLIQTLDTALSRS